MLTSEEVGMHPILPSLSPPPMDSSTQTIWAASASVAVSHGLVAAATFPRMASRLRRLESAMLRVAASHGLIAHGDLS